MGAGPIPWQMILRYVLSLFGGIALASFATAIAFDAAMRERAPASALKVWPSDGLASANLARGSFAEQMLGRSDPLSVIPDEETIALSRRALATEPLASDAITLIALAERDADRRFALLQSAGRIDKRSALTQSRLLLDYAERGQNDDAIATMYRIMRVHPEQRGAYVQALAQSLAAPGDQAPTVALLKKDPELANGVLRSAAAGDDTVRIAARIRVEARLTPLVDRQTDQAILAGLTRIGAFDSAFQFYWLLKKRRLAQLKSASTDLEQNDYPPIDWSFADAGRLSAQWAGGPADGIRIVVPSTSAGQLASRLIRLPPGAYRLQTTILPGAGDLALLDLGFKIECAEPDVDATTLDIKIGDVKTGRGSPSNAGIVIPPNICQYFRISLIASGIRSPSDVELVMRGANLVSPAGPRSSNSIEIF